VWCTCLGRTEAPATAGLLHYASSTHMFSSDKLVWLYGGSTCTCSCLALHMERSVPTQGRYHHCEAHYVTALLPAQALNVKF